MISCRRLFASLRALSVVAACVWCAAPVQAQIPIPLREQIEAFSTLPAAQQQALIRELQRQLPPAQREAVLGMLQRGSTQSGAGTAETPNSAQTVDSISTGLLTGFESLDFTEPFSGGDTLIIGFADRGDDAVPDSQFRLRLEDGNPYELDSAGRLFLPGVPPIELAGLDVDQATIRVSAERELRDFDLIITRLPLEPVGTAALEPFGYDLFRGVPSTFAPATDIPVPVDYVIGPGDTINVQLFGNQNAEYFLTVSREGTINFPEIGPLNVSRLPFADVRNLINERVSEQMIGVRASSTLGELRSIRVFVLGDVEQPGSYTVSGLATMTNALLASGGVTDIGSLRQIALNRDGETVSTLDLYDLLLRGDTRGDARLQPGDVIFVPPVGATVAVDGQVRRPAIYELGDEQTVAELIALAGGMTANANQSAVKVERIVPGRGIAVADLDLLGAAGPDTAVRNGDVIRVDPNLEQLEASVRLVGNVQRPGLYQWRDGMRISDLLPAPELVKPLSDLNYVLIRREVASNVEIDVLSVDLEAIWQRGPGAADLDLEPRDTVYVFQRETGRQQYVTPIIEELEAQVNPNQPLPIVRVGGQVRAAGTYPLEPGMRVSDLLRAGGGLTDAAYVIEAELTRFEVIDNEYRETELVSVDLARIGAGDPGADVALRAYDFLNVKEVSRWRDQEFVTLSGEFVFPGTYPIRQGERLSSVLDRAGGLSDLAFPEGSVFMRRDLRQREREQLELLARRIETDLAATSVADPSASETLAIGQTLIDQLRNAQPVGRLVIDLDALVAGDTAYDIVLRDGDELIVPQVTQEVMVLGEVQFATSHLFTTELDKDDYIALSGGTTRRADKRRTYVVRANGSVARESGARWFRRGARADIRPGDTIVVPLDTERVRPLVFWQGVTEVLYNIAVAFSVIDRINN